MTYQRARGEEYDDFLRLTREHGAAYLERTLALMGMTWEAYAQLFRTVGEVYGVYEDGDLAGFYWVEERESVLHLHGLILKEGFRGRGIGTRVLHDLEARCGQGLAAIELGVHESNRRAKALYERLGYETVKRLCDVGFEVMQKQLGTVSDQAVRLRAGIE